MNEPHLEESHLDEPQVPEGFAPHFRKSPLTDPWEPLYSRRTENAVILGFRATEHHTNSRGFVHGGLLTALADNAMGLSCATALDQGKFGEGRFDEGRFDEGRPQLVTISLNIDFLSVAHIGQWIEIDTSFTRPGSTICFAQAFITADGQNCARANATFRVSAQKAHERKPS
jgi:acyl-coenzyme A thioesterase PaaI-like protein